MAGLDLTKQDLLLLAQCGKATESKLVILVTSLTVILHAKLCVLCPQTSNQQTFTEAANTLFLISYRVP